LEVVSTNHSLMSSKEEIHNLIAGTTDRAWI